MKKFERFTVTSALPYTNGPVHIGQLAGAYVPADIYVRYLRLKYGEDKVLFVCGSDEHGVPITLKAEKEGLSPQQIVDRYHQIIKKSFEEFGISFNVYHRTSDPLHHQTASDFFNHLYKKGIFSEKETEQYYDAEKNQFLADRYISGTCPNCGFEKAYGDQCEKCGTSLDASQLINPVSTISGNQPVLKKTRHLYMQLNEMQEWMENWIVEGSGRTEKWKKNVLGQCKSWLKEGLQARSMTRDLDWGVKVPIEGFRDKVLYVWFDAPIGYISATKAWAEKQGRDWEPFWKDENTKLVHFIGKDNIVFHCIIFPAMLQAEGSYILPTNVPANEFMNMEGEKMSTSKNWTVWLHEYLGEFPDQKDTLRYVLTANMPETKDSEFTWRDFQNRNNQELVANLGNFINRVWVLTHKYFDGRVPEAAGLVNGEPLIEAVNKSWKSIEGHLENYEFKLALADLMALSALGNKFLADQEPWKLIKTDEKRTADVLHWCLQLAAQLTSLMEPFLPFTSERMKKMFGAGMMESDGWLGIYSPLIKPQSVLNKAELLFKKIDDSVVEAQLLKLQKSKEAQKQEITVEPIKEQVDFESFAALDIRMGTILTAEKMKKANKLLQLLIDIGSEKRTIVSGLAEHFKPEELIGKQVAVLVNLEPRKLRGVLSEGMVLTAESPSGELSLIEPERPVENGSRVA